MSIAESDLFVADLTNIGTSVDDKKKLQNPNVLIELGYAVSQLGWDRIIILFHNGFGGFNDLPFDMEKRSLLSISKLSSFPEILQVHNIRTEWRESLQMYNFSDQIN